MREIKFRGKCSEEVCLGEWKCGYLEDSCRINMFDKTGLMHEIVYKIDPETVGQFTGLYDKNGKEIYEDDIVKKTCIYGYVGMFYTGEVVFKDGSFVIDTHDKYDSLRYTNFDYKCKWNDGHCHGVDEYEFEVIGNIYDNPDLIKEE